MNEKVQIKCLKHGLFEQTPTLHKRTGGCKKCSDEKTYYEIYKNRKTILYYVKINKLWKVGLSIIDNRYSDIKNNIIKKRFGGKEYNKYDISIINYKIYDDGFEAYKTEQVILKENDDIRYYKNNFDMNNFIGFTELLSEPINF